MRKIVIINGFLFVVIFIIFLMISSISSACDCDKSISLSNRSNFIDHILDIITEKYVKMDDITDEDIWQLKEINIAENRTYTVDKNPATKYPLDYMCGLKEPEGWWRNAHFDPCLPTRDLPSSFDWRDVNGTDYTTSIKNQGSCGSCWAFGTVGPLECNIKIKDGIEVDLSEQWLVNCNQEGWGCDGGWWAHDYHEWKNDSCNGSGAVLEEYCPYTALDDPCTCPYPHDYFINNWSFIGTEYGVPPVESIKQAIYNYGPVSVALCVNNAFRAYTGGIFDGPSCTDINHAVTLVGWNDSQGSEGVWILRNSWGTNWGEDGYMRIEYGVSQIGYAACYVNYSGTPRIQINFPNGIPESISPNYSTNISIEIEQINDLYVNETGKIYYRYDNGPFLNSSLIYVDETSYEAYIPPSNCGDIVEFYFSVEGNKSGLIFEPQDAPNITYFCLVGDLKTVFYDDFENDLGWTVQNDINLTDGAWDRGIPVGGGDRGDPASDQNGSGSCYLTDNEYGNSDVDDGITWLISPIINLSGGLNAKIDFGLWYTNNFGNDPNNDIFKIYVSNNSGSDWILVKEIGPVTPSPRTWYNYSIILSKYTGKTNQMKFRFEASDLNDGSVVEAGIDNFCVKLLECSNDQRTLELQANWNFISLPFNNSMNKSSIIIRFNESEFSWEDAVNNNIIINYVYQWNRSIQNYGSVNILNPGYGYWCYSYENCYLCFNGVNTSLNDNLITDAKFGWNIIGLPDNKTIDKENLIIFHNNTNIDWQEAVDNNIILDFIYGWNKTNQNYKESGSLHECQAYWLYAYEECRILKPET